jgi:hypothetical protein
VKTTYKIHPAIGIARVGNCPEQFYLAPETTGALPIACDNQGNPIPGPDGTEQTTTQMKDAQGRILRQGARFQVFVYDDKTPEGRVLKIGDTVDGVDGGGKLVDIRWSVYLANKKASWYQFKELEGEHGYAPDHPLRNADVQGDARNALIIDPGFQTASLRGRRSAEFARGANPTYAQTFPPPLVPNSIDTLGGLRIDDQGRLIVLGGHGNSGSYLTGLGQPSISNFANNDGWFDDVSDGPVTAILEFDNAENQDRELVQVNESSWVIVGNPGYAPNIVNMITLDDTIYDLSVREFAYNTDMYGTDFSKPVKVDASDPTALAGWRNAAKRWNPNYYPYFYRDIWPILLRPYNAQWVTDFLAISHDAHETGPRGDFEQSKISQPPSGGSDPYRDMRMFVYSALRKPGQENLFQNVTASPADRIYGKPLMPLLCGDNPLSNQLVSKFLTLTPTQIFILHQWACGKFINEQNEQIADSTLQPHGKGVALDRGVLSNVLGGAFCPGGEIGWICRNPAIYSSPYRIHWNPAFLPTAGSGRKSAAEFFPQQLDLTDNFEAGMEPGDLTKRSALPWQADFNECSTQPIDVTYTGWNNLYAGDGDPALKQKNRKINVTLWWPTHRPMQVYKLRGPAAVFPPDNPGSYTQVDWATGIPQTNAGDLKMVTAWSALGFVLTNPYATPANGVPPYTEVE